MQIKYVRPSRKLAHFLAFYYLIIIGNFLGIIKGNWAILLVRYVLRIINSLGVFSINVK